MIEKIMMKQIGRKEYSTIYIAIIFVYPGQRQGVGLGNRQMMKSWPCGIGNGKTEWFKSIFIIAFPVELVGEGEGTDL